jgi:hypothetical protein
LAGDASRAGRTVISMWRGWPSRWRQEADVMENKSGKMLNGVQNGLNLQLHRWSLVSLVCVFIQLAN